MADTVLCFWLTDQKFMQGLEMKPGLAADHASDQGQQRGT